VVGAAGTLIAGILQLVIGLYGRALLQFGALAAMTVLPLLQLYLDDRDEFGKDIVVPAGMHVVDPVGQFAPETIASEDLLAESILAAYSPNANPSSEPPLIRADLPELDEFATSKRAALVRQLASDPKWQVIDEDGRHYAYRRLAFGGRYESTPEGYYGSVTTERPSLPFLVRIVIGFDGPVFAGSWRGRVTEGVAGGGGVVVQATGEGVDRKESYFVLRSKGAALEIFEQSRFNGRPATLCALGYVQQELRDALTKSVDAGAVAQALPPTIALANGIQGGIYHVRAYVNPGESGRAYLKVFEATKNTPLSADSIASRSTAVVRWSLDPTQRFIYEREVTVFEGSWGIFYPARFELWFIPDAGAPERKLVEETFRIDGWER